ncbi:hypothetical protein PSQ20_21705 [Curvibacter sp. RS43]|uniref:PP_RS20740 family protein n=1 Tax=Curvibacter microcysteis TaxID=3026419 RepID=UPI002361FAFE|nr:hypothetical protein [Curvibacter sp. RS43]MDD0812966.1 hypothetical protein [Curvibacter sp. RS43]
MMNNTVAGEEEGHADNIIEVQAYEAPMPSQRAKDIFLAWHRPRKQYVRHHQWCREVQALIATQKPKEGVLKYLGLPGLDLLDLRHFHAAICVQHAVKLRFLGFNTSARPNSAAQTELNVSMDEVKRLVQVDPRSEVIGDDFKQLANQKSMAFQKARELGPYDVINLDLCDGFGAGAPGGLQPSYYTAVNNLLSIQARNPAPWLLFLTTRADKPNINEAVLKVLIDKYCANLAQCPSFRDASRDHFAIETDEAVARATEQPKGLLEVFLTGLCKWFLGLALGHTPPISVELISVVGYRVDKGAEHEDLVSLALKFTPTHIAALDPLRLAADAANGPDEGTLATKALRKVAKRLDADKKLANDAALLKQMTEDTASLLRLARYDAQKYMEWVAAL